MREDGLDQAEALIGYHMGLAQDEINQLSDKQFIETAALAYFYEDRRAVAVMRGVLMAVKEMFE